MKSSDRPISNKVAEKATRRDFLKTTATVVGAAAISGAPYIRSAEAAATTNWKIQTSWPGGIGAAQAGTEIVWICHPVEYQ